VEVVEALLRRLWSPLVLVMALLVVAVVAVLELELDPSSCFAFQGREPSSATEWR